MPKFLASLTREGALIPLPEFVDTLENIGHGEIVRVDVKLARDITTHRRFFAMLQQLWHMESIQEEYKSFDDLREDLLIDAGHCVSRQHELVADGEKIRIITRRAKSIAFENCDETEFVKVYNQAVNVVTTQWLPRFQPDDYMDYMDVFLRF